MHTRKDETVKAKADTYYILYIGDKFIADHFATLKAALDFGNHHKQICKDCQVKPLMIEKVRVRYETTVIYDERKDKRDE